MHAAHSLFAEMSPTAELHREKEMFEMINKGCEGGGGVFEDGVVDDS